MCFSLNQVARREIGVLTTNKCVIRTAKVKRPDIDEKPVKYVRKPIDYSMYDDMGHGVRISRHSANLDPLAKIGVNRQNSYSSTHSSNGIQPTSSGVQQAPDNMATPPPHLKGINNGLGTIRSINSGSTQYFRTPVAPPSVPSEYLSRQELGIYSSKKELNQSAVADSLSAAGGYGGPTVQEMAHQQLHSAVNQNTSRNTNNQNNSSLLSNRSSGSMTQGLPPPPPPIMFNPEHPFPPQPVNFNVNTCETDPIENEIFGVDYIDRVLNLEVDNMDDDGIIPNWVPIERCMEKVITTYDYEGLRDDELSFKENMFIYVIKKNDDHWYEGIMKTETGNIVQGLYPYNYARCVRKFMEDSRVTVHIVGCFYIIDHELIPLINYVSFQTERLTG